MLKAYGCQTNWGGGNPKGAKLAVRVALSMVFIEGLLMVLTMILMRNVWGDLYSDDRHVIRYLSTVMPILAIASFLNAIQGTLSGIYVCISSYYDLQNIEPPTGLLSYRLDDAGVLAGCGWQKTGAYVNLALCCWCTMCGCFGLFLTHACHGKYILYAVFFIFHRF